MAKIVAVVLILRLGSRGQRSSALRLHLFNWALKRSSRLEQLQASAAGSALRVIAWGFDPALEAALRFAEAERLIARTGDGGAYVLAEKGAALADEVSAASELMSAEWIWIGLNAKRVTEKMVLETSRGWGE